MSRPPLSVQPLSPRDARRRRLVLAALGLPPLAGVAGCGGGHDDRPADPLLRFVNGTRDVTLASFYVDDLFATSLNLGGIGSIYGELSRATHTVSVRQGGNELERVQLAFFGDSATTILAYGSTAPGGDVRFWVVAEDSARPAPGQVRLRAFHAAVHRPQPLAVHVGAAGAPLGTPTFTLDAYETRSGFVEVRAGTYRVRVTPAGAPDDLLLDYPAALLPADTVWHLAVVPRAAGSDRVNIAAIRERGDGQTWTA
ncbi:MAG: DUF4397 domain-containing protein [Pseudomonadota bacterium]